MTQQSGESHVDYEVTMTTPEQAMDWPEKLREAAHWFDLIDRLLAGVTIEDNKTGDVKRLVDEIGAGREIQDDLLRLADALTAHHNVTIRHYLVVNDDGSGSSMFGVSTREESDDECLRRARRWVMAGYHIEVREQTFLVGPSEWRTLCMYVLDADGVERKVEVGP